MFRRTIAFQFIDEIEISYVNKNDIESNIHKTFNTIFMDQT